MIIQGDLFRLRIEDAKDQCSSGRLVYLEIEDDGIWHTKVTFDAYWLPDLKDIVESAFNEAKEIKLKR